MAKGKWPPPGYPIVEGEQRLTATWSMQLPEKFARRIEDGSLVLWRPGLTIWLAAWDNNHAQTQAERLAKMKQWASPDRFAERQSEADGVTRYSYRLREESDNGPVESVNGFTIDDEGHIQSSVYFDNPADAEVARQLVESVKKQK